MRRTSGLCGRKGTSGRGGGLPGGRRPAGGVTRRRTVDQDLREGRFASAFLGQSIKLRRYLGANSERLTTTLVPAAPR